MKIDRLLAITVLLLNRGRVSAKELADRFEVSSKTIYRDMDTLSQAGIPIAAHQGINGGFEMMANYTIDRHWLSEEEMSTLISAVEGLNSALEDQKMEALTEKVRALLNRISKGREPNRSALVMDLAPWSQREAEQRLIRLFRQAIEEHRQVKLDYIQADGATGVRIIEPYALLLKRNTWYVQAYCTLRVDYRLFRLSRVECAELMAVSFEPRDIAGSPSFPWGYEAETPPVTEVELLFRPGARQRIADLFLAEQVTVQENGTLAVCAAYTIDEWFYGTLLSFGNEVKVIQPEWVANEIKHRAHLIMSQYRN